MLFKSRVIDKYFISEEIQKDSILLKRARMLTWVCLGWTFGGLIMAISHAFLTHVDEFPTYKVLVFGLLSISSFKYFSSFDLSANLLALGLAFILVPMVNAGGGLYSDNLLWLAFCPMIVALFGEKRYDLVWFLAFIVFIFIQYQKVVGNPSLHLEVIANYGAEYFLASFVFFATIVLGIVWMFKYGNDAIFKSFKRNQKILEDKHLEVLLANRRLSEATNQLSRSNKELEAFASIASHDLKEPLRMVSMYAQLLKKRLGNDLNEEQVTFMGYIQEGTTHMQKLLDDILEYSRVGRSNERIKLVDLDDVVYYVKKMIAASVAETNAQIIVEKPLPEVYGRYSELVQVFQNLLSNSIKFRRKGVTPVIRIGYLRESESHLITVSDNGIGIEKKYAERVFQMFEKLHTKTEYSGTGIGLALCYKIIQQMGGQIWLDTPLGEGTSFSIRLPVSVQVLDENKEKG